MAYDREQKQLYASAFVKRHAGLGSLGEGGIYKIDYSSSDANVVQLYVVRRNAGVVVRPSGDLGGPLDPNQDADAFGKISKAGLGDLNISIHNLGTIVGESEHR
ncbi:MAG: hypothetical protein R2792_09375 [Saprospiraceae bacterium]